MRDPFDETVSVVEELDPDPAPRVGWTHFRELVLGLILVAAVLVWGGWDWWHQEYNQNNYRLGQQAAASQDWDNAFLYFSKVPGYKDAKDRAAEMNKLVTDREKQYKIASTAASEQDWATTLQAARAVRAIQKDYRDSAQLEVDSAAQVYRGALEGSVALRTQARKAALYYRTADGWEWLPRSDRSSQVLRSFDASGAIVYDAPGENWDELRRTPTATPNPNSMVPGMPQLKGRRLMVARYQGKDPVFTTVDIDPSEYNFYWVGEKGMWAFRVDDSAYDSRRSRVALGFAGLIIAYQAFGSSQVDKLNAEPGWISMDFSPDGEHILLVDQGPSSTAEPPLKLYLADGKGTSKRLIYTHDGDLQGVHFSPDSRYVLASTYVHPRLGDTESFGTVLINLEDGKASKLVEKTVKYDQQRTNYPLPLASTFVRAGPLAGHVLIADQTDEHPLLYFFAPDDPSTPAVTLKTGSVQTGATWASPIWATLYSDNIVLAWQERAGSTGSGGHLRTLQIKPDLSMDSSTTPIGGTGWLAYVGVRGNWMIYGTREYGGGGDNANKYSVFSQPLSPQSDAPKATTIFSAALDDIMGFPLARAVYPGSKMLAYVNNGDLHVRTYDGKVDLTLESGVLQLYDPMYNAAWLELR
ncbi:MAG TPA: WD40 repeat domain-containing protein [Chloroflexia bacterium]|nr:WD40 repeat domain-containing protein [Chloroflexia bacterium]